MGAKRKPIPLCDGEVDWTKMAGDTPLEKRINAYLTRQFISKTGMPVDECLREAKYILALVRKHNRR